MPEPPLTQLNIPLFILYSRMNMIELRLLLTCCGLFAVLMGLGVAIGVMSVIGLPYIPLHAMLPFVCLGKFSVYS